MTDEELDRAYDAAYFCAMQPSEGVLQYPLPMRAADVLRRGGLRVTDEELDRAWTTYEDAVMRDMKRTVEQDLLSQDWFTGPSATNGHAPSESWCDKTPTDILADVNALLATINIVPAPMPALFQMPYATYRWLANLSRRDRVKRLLNSRRARRPERFTAR